MKKILFISATHGDEGFSIKVLDELERKYPKDKYGFERIIGNPRALALGVRGTDGNLNRLAPGKPKSKIYEERRAFGIMKIVKNYDYVIDLHGANSKCGIVIIICNPILPNFILAGMFDIKKIVIWSTKEDYKSGPLTQFCKTGLEIECGIKTDLEIQKELKIVLKKFIKNYQKMDVKKIMDNLRQKELYVVYDKLMGKDKSLQDFKKIKKEREVFYPFMADAYPGIACYKVRKIKFQKLFLAFSKV